jgi:hypothetical protein
LAATLQCAESAAITVAAGGTSTAQYECITMTAS